MKRQKGCFSLANSISPYVETIELQTIKYELSNTMAEIQHVPGRNLYSVVVLMQKTSSVDALDEKCVRGTVKKNVLGMEGCLEQYSYKALAIMKTTS